ncbi:MAG: L-threonine 3-dehydrogenase [Eubacteriales bacterium]
MPALMKKYPEKGLWLEEVDVPAPQMGEVLIKIEKTSICGTDLHIYNWEEWSQRTIPVPMVTGHEFVGHIAKLGENVHGLKEGDLVSGEGHIVCGKCRNCLAGRRHLCNHTMGVGVNRQGAFAEYLCIPAGNVWLCDEKIDHDVLACFDPLGNAVHTALTYDMIGEDVLITGAGPIGIMAAAVARHVGARNVVITDINPFRLEMAKQAGVNLAIDVRKHTISEAMQNLHMREGFDVGLEMSGSPSAFTQMVDNMIHGGRIALLGLQTSADIDWSKVIFNSLVITGIYGREMFETWYKMTSMLQSGLDISSVITHRFHYTEYEKGFAAMNEGKSGKVILNWE